MTDRRPEFFARLLVVGLCLGVVLVPLAFRPGSDVATLHARLAEDGGWSPQALQAEVGMPFKLRLTSDDVQHGFAVGQMDMQPVDVEPGRVSELMLLFKQPGTYTFYCTRWCGLNHWRMRGTIEVRGADGSLGPAGGTAEQPLYVRLGLDIDTPHPAAFTPAAPASARNGITLAERFPELFARFSSTDTYRSHSPAELFAALGEADPALGASQRWDLVAAAWAANTTPAGLANGRIIYSQNCAACHGENGGGDGVFADQLAAAGAASMQAMSGEMSIQRPANFSDPARLLGASPALLQGKILRGGMGSGMPIWGNIFSEPQIWDVIAYLYSFQFKENP